MSLEIAKRHERGLFRLSSLAFTARYVCIRKKDDTLSLCEDHLRLTFITATDSGGLG